MKLRNVDLRKSKIEIYKDQFSFKKKERKRWASKPDTFIAQTKIFYYLLLIKKL